MRAIVLSIALLASSSAPARELTLAEAVELAMRVDPLVAESRIAESRSRNAVLRSQLDRISLKIDGSLQELWTKTNIAGPRIPPLCTIGPITTFAEASDCTTLGGTSSPSDQSPSGGQGLFNLQAALSVPVFSGLRVESTIALRQRQRDAAIVVLRQTRKDTAPAGGR